MKDKAVVPLSCCNHVRVLYEHVGVASEQCRRHRAVETSHRRHPCVMSFSVLGKCLVQQSVPGLRAASAIDLGRSDVGQTLQQPPASQQNLAQCNRA